MMKAFLAICILAFVAGASAQITSPCSPSNIIGTCPLGQACVLGTCMGASVGGGDSACSASNIAGTCPTGQYCYLGTCTATGTTGTGSCSILNPLGTCPSGQSCLAGTCVGSSGTGSTCSILNPLGSCPTGQSCLAGTCVGSSGTGSTCSILNPLGSCPTGQTCLAGICSSLNVGATCSATNIAGTCPTGQYCYLGTCTATGTTGTGTCSILNPLGTCPTGQACVSGACIGGTGTGGVTITIGSCSPKCADGETCILGLCLRTQRPTCSTRCTADQYCAATGSGSTGVCQSLNYCPNGCSYGTTCVVGTCVPTFAGYDNSCYGGCNSGETCQFGRCVFQSSCSRCNATAGEVCRSGSCVAPSAANTCASTCPAGTYCSYGSCVSCGALCQAVGASADLSQNLMNAFAGFGASLDVAANQFAQATAASINGFTQAFQAATNAAITFNSTVQTANTPLVFNYNGGFSSTPAFANVGAGAQVNFPVVKVNTNAPAAIAVAAGSRINSTLADIAAKTIIAFDNAANAGAAAFDRIVLSAPLYVSGPGLFNFPARANDSTCTGTDCTCNVAGGARLNGNAGSIAINIQPTSTAEARARVDFGNTFATWGNIMGAATAVLEVAGEMWAYGQTVQPHARIQNGGKMVVNNTGIFQGGDVTVQTGATLNIKNGAQAYLQKFVCAAGATLAAEITTQVDLTRGGIFLNYAQNTDVSQLQCGITLKDSTGATFLVTNPSTGATTTSRRLLGTSCTTTWGTTSAAYQCSNTGAASSVTVSVAMIIASIIAAVAMMF